jgi:hypothetical protein
VSLLLSCRLSLARKIFCCWEKSLEEAAAITEGVDVTLDCEGGREGGREGGKGESLVVFLVFVLIICAVTQTAHPFITTHLSFSPFFSSSFHPPLFSLT